MHPIILIAGALVALGVGLDAFQTVILPRRPSGRLLRITQIFYLLTWTPWVCVAEWVRSRKLREQIYSIFGPVSLLLLLGLWALLLVVAFGMIYFGLGTPFHDTLTLGHGQIDRLGTAFYVSGTTLFTLGLGDVIPTSRLARMLVAMEAGTGLGFVALVIGYVPILYQTFSHREVSVALLDVRAGSPPTATELLRRHSFEGGDQALIQLLAEWERWSAEILETHVSYPLLAYYRSQHDNQSWLTALVAVLDTCALLITTIDGPSVRQAQLTFATARHAVVDLGHVFHIEGLGTRVSEAPDRLPKETFYQLCDSLGQMEVQLCGDPEAMKRLTAIRKLYEPHAFALAEYLKMPLPLWVAEPKKTDQWKTVADLRMTREAVLRGSSHVSAQSTSAAHLHEEEDF
ncbi:two pore domain potassium channel family protein [Granulicella sp. WH15]|uniref:potassium channel family protein n=1 Tax=Granulicella sp. WH15 TaxID=2602070 RepID=UPI001366F266|nr:potassium channel family protein [Granulicella sp. WH15]QHN05055.1 two pore domain potassium channel family protein [Granulicella sp. WH15]